MLRCVAVLLCVATSQGIRLSAPTDELKVLDVADEQAVLATAVQEGIAFDDDLIDPTEEIDPKAKGKVDEKDDDQAKLAKALQIETKMIKEGDGKAFVTKGDTVKVRMAGPLKMKHYHDQQFVGIYDFVHPMPSMPGSNGQANPMSKVKDIANEQLPKMSVGSIVQMTATDTSTGEVLATTELELLELTKAPEEPPAKEKKEKKKKGSAAEESEELESVEPPQLEKVGAETKMLAKQKAGALTMRRQVLKEGDGKTFAKAGDIITMRQIGTLKAKGQKITMNTTTTYEYPMLMEPYTMKVKGNPIKVKYAIDEKVAPELSLGEMQHISFDPIRIQMGALFKKTYRFPSFDMELVDIQPAK